MKILHVAPGHDTGGQAWWLTALWSSVRPEDEVRSYVASQTYIGYPMDRRFRHEAVGRDWREWADVVHLHNFPQVYDRFDHGARKPLVMHYHGTLFRSDPATQVDLSLARGATQVVSTVDLLLAAPDAPLRWLPQIVDVARLQHIRQERYRPSDTIRIVHAPTDRQVKGTRHVMTAVETLRKRGRNVDLILVERLPWTRCQEKKAQGDVYVDQMILGYGNNAIEAWALGMPVVANAADPAILARMRREYHTRTLPFLQADPDTLADVLDRLVTSPQERQEWAERGARHVARFHAPEAAIARLAGIYGATGPSTGGPKPGERPAGEKPAYVRRYIRRREEREQRARERAATLGRVE